MRKIIVIIIFLSFTKPFVSSTLPNTSHVKLNFPTSITFGALTSSSALVESFNNESCITDSAITPMIITPPPGGGSGGTASPTISIHIDIFQSDAEIAINGAGPYYDGQSVTLDASSVYTIDVISVAQGFKFFQWETNAGAITDYESPLTDLITGSNSGILTLVLNNTQITNAWAGFVQSGTVSTVTGEFYVPSVIYGNSGTAEFAPWVGIGGYSGGNLWQAGVAITVTRTSEIIEPWYEEAVSALSSPVYNNGFTINTNDLVQIWVNYSGGHSTFKLIDHTTGKSWGNTFSFTPADNSAEWIVEDPNYGSYILPQYNDVTWTLASSNNGNLISPITAVTQFVGSAVSYDNYITEPNQFSTSYG